MVLLSGLLIYLALLLRNLATAAIITPATICPVPLGTGTLLMLAALGLLGLAGHLLLGAAVTLATELGLSERIIGLTIIAVSTSLPELATSLIAAFRGQRNCRRQRDW